MRIDASANDVRSSESSRSMHQTRLLGWIRRKSGALLLLIIAMPMMAAAQERQLQFVSTAWSPFTNAPGPPRLALDLVGEALERMGIIRHTREITYQTSQPTPAFGSRLRFR